MQCGSSRRSRHMNWLSRFSRGFDSGEWQQPGSWLWEPQGPRHGPWLRAVDAGYNAYWDRLTVKAESNVIKSVETIDASNLVYVKVLGEGDSEVRTPNLILHVPREEPRSPRSRWQQDAVTARPARMASHDSSLAEGVLVSFSPGFVSDIWSANASGHIYSVVQSAIHQRKCIVLKHSVDPAFGVHIDANAKFVAEIEYAAAPVCSDSLVSPRLLKLTSYDDNNNHVNISVKETVDRQLSMPPHSTMSFDDLGEVYKNISRKRILSKVQCPNIHFHAHANGTTTVHRHRTCRGGAQPDQQRPPFGRTSSIPRRPAPTTSSRPSDTDYYSQPDLHSRFKINPFYSLSSSSSSSSVTGHSAQSALCRTFLASVFQSVRLAKAHAAEDNCWQCHDFVRQFNRDLEEILQKSGSSDLRAAVDLENGLWNSTLPSTTSGWVCPTLVVNRKKLTVLAYVAMVLLAALLLIIVVIVLTLFFNQQPLDFSKG